MDYFDRQDDYLDRRKHARFALENTTGYIMLSSAVRIVNISIGGALLETQKAIALGDLLELRLSEGGRDLFLKATAVWSSADEANGVKAKPWLTGVKFVEDSSEKTVRLINLILENNGQYIGGRASISCPVKVHMKKLSEDGLLLQSEQELRADQSLPISIAISDGMALKCVGRVVSTTAVDKGGRPLFQSRVDLLQLPNSRKFMVVKT